MSRVLFMLQLQNYLINKKVFVWRKSCCSPWAKKLYNIFEEMETLYIYRSNLCFFYFIQSKLDQIKIIWKYLVKTIIKDMCISNKGLALTHILYLAFLETKDFRRRVESWYSSRLVDSKLQMIVWAVWLGWSEKWLPFSFVLCKLGRESIFHEMAWQNLEIFRCTGEQ